MPKFDIAIMNPPFANAKDTFLDVKITNSVKEFSDIIISIFPQKLTSKFKTSMNFCDDPHLECVNILNGNNKFDISSKSTEFTAIYKIDMNKTFTDITVDGKPIKKGDVNAREMFIKEKYFSKNIIKLIERLTPLYEKLLKENKSMCNDSDSYIYEENENRVSPQKNQKELANVKAYLKNGDYKYCLYKGSFNHKYDDVQEYADDTSILQGQVCWLMNKLNVKNNMRYWMESPLFDLWRRWFFYRSGAVARSGYRAIPALPFDISEDEFKEMVDNLYDFTKEDIDAMENLNVHNINRLKHKKQ